MMESKTDLQRLQQEYSRRAGESKTKDRYSSENPAHQWMISDRQRKIRDLLKKGRIHSFQNLSILEIGCGSGGVINEFLRSGVVPSRLCGLDLLFDRLEEASESLPDCAWINANGQDLPFKDESFDLALQFTAFSSVLDPEIKRDMAESMLRVLKPDGGVLWYDFIWNPTNSQTKGIGLKEIKSLFPGCTFLVSRITLAPPLIRLLLPKFPRLVERLSSLIMLNSHLLVWIQKRS